jgi:hypothetical protein
MAGADALDDDGSLLKYEETEYLALVTSDEPFMPLVRWSFLSLNAILNTGFV